MHRDVSCKAEAARHTPKLDVVGLVALPEAIRRDLAVVAYAEMDGSGSQRERYLFTQRGL